jgi:hypothetical protein
MSTEQTTEEKKAPSKEEILNYLQEQIEVKKVQLELQQLSSQLAIAKAEELKALAFIAQITNPQQEEEEDEQEESQAAKTRTLKKDK